MTTCISDDQRDNYQDFCRRHEDIYTAHGLILPVPIIHFTLKQSTMMPIPTVYLLYDSEQFLLCSNFGCFIFCNFIFLFPWNRLFKLSFPEVQITFSIYSINLFLSEESIKIQKQKRTYIKPSINNPLYMTID